MYLHLIYDVFWAKHRKMLKLEKLENMMKKQSTLRKNASSSRKASSQKWEGGNRPLCLLTFACEKTKTNNIRFTSRLINWQQPEKF